MVAGVDLDEVAMPSGDSSSEDARLSVELLTPSSSNSFFRPQDRISPPNTTAIDNALNRVFSHVSLRSFHSQLAEAVAHNQRRTLCKTSTDETLDGFLTQYCAQDRLTPSFVQALTRMWTALEAREHSLEVLDLKLAVERRRLMLTNAAAWLWLTNDCAKATRSYLDDKNPETIVNDEPIGWLCKLGRQIYIWRVCEEGGDVHPGHFIDGWDEAVPSIKVPRPQNHKDIPVIDWVVQQVVRVVRTWARFPTNTRLVAAYFVCHIVRTFHNPDVLLLPHMWRMHQNIKTELLQSTSLRHTSLTLAMLQPVVDVLSKHPLADVNSPESALMHDISALVTICMPSIKDLSVHLIMSLGLHDPDRLASPQVPLTNNLPPITQGNRLKGLQGLKKFIRELLPLVDGESLKLPQNPTKLQSLVMSRPDFYCPFRELAPSRRILTGPDGPFHSNQRDLPGAFASWVLSRIALFESPVLGRHTSGFFADKQAWTTFLHACDYDGTEKSARSIVNVACYGTPQPQRWSVLGQVDPYFAADTQWQNLVRAHLPNTIPFLELYHWLQTTTRPTPKTVVRFLPQVGKLAAYLLAGDLVYCGKVQLPGPAEMGRIIALNKLGSLKGLVATGELQSTESSEEDVIEAFKRVYNAVEETVGSMGEAIRLDTIMVEHLLCKFQRVQKRSL